ncbi:hypothetical protein A0J61_00304 [Choanephora cucurbitarum]|uniref:Uncharacterized protein n=1 Tax=Choanephora cucurbitarum TaxID=101091 RepID=A0A1C7NSI4_9FUNG|nr:hypothetical protein A0J61_00304 [Choanephora cucurbitarum]
MQTKGVLFANKAIFKNLCSIVYLHFTCCKAFLYQEEDKARPIFRVQQMMAILLNKQVMRF